MNAAKEKESILHIRALAGQIGVNRYESPEMADAENYESQVQIGLACSAVEILDHDPSRIIEWFGHCLIACGAKIDPAIGSLLDDLESRVGIQLRAKNGDPGA